MSFSKAQDLIRLARLAHNRRRGISLGEIREEFAVSHRTAQSLSDDFDLETYAARFFGIYQDPDQYLENVWRFSPDIADRAAEFIFHPDQTLTREADCGLTVRFAAGGWMEMLWHLYQWGDKVDVLAPEKMRQLVKGHQRRDFTGLP